WRRSTPPRTTTRATSGPTRRSRIAWRWFRRRWPSFANSSRAKSRREPLTPPRRPLPQGGEGGARQRLLSSSPPPFVGEWPGVGGLASHVTELHRLPQALARVAGGNELLPDVPLVIDLHQL